MAEQVHRVVDCHTEECCPEAEGDAVNPAEYQADCGGRGKCCRKNWKRAQQDDAERAKGGRQYEDNEDDGCQAQQSRLFPNAAFALAGNGPRASDEEADVLLLLWQIRFGRLKCVVDRGYDGGLRLRIEAGRTCLRKQQSPGSIRRKPDAKAGGRPKEGTLPSAPDCGGFSRWVVRQQVLAD